VATLLLSTASCGTATAPATTQSTASPTGPSATPWPSRFGPTEPLPPYFEPWLPVDSRPRDSNGVALWDYEGSLGKQYYPVTIAQAALRYYNRWYLSSGRLDADREAFFTQVRWLVANQTADGRWLVYFHWGKQPVPWWSGMAEGLAISALIRAYALTGDSLYLTVIERARDALRRSVKDKGTTQTLTVSGTKIVVIQEYLPGYVQNVLNGWIFALVGLYEAALYLDDDVAAFEFYGPDRGVSAVRTLLPYYDTGSWSFYSLRTLSGAKRGPLAKPLYHRIHIDQLRFLAAITGDAVLADYAARFQRYQDARSG
jgi:heparosan-N-sulfate-glucuronate 5-epimerase